MIERIRFENFKALKDATLELGQFNVLVGPNGSGKSTVFQFFEAVQKKLRGSPLTPNEIRTVGSVTDPKVQISWEWQNRSMNATIEWNATGGGMKVNLPDHLHHLRPAAEQELQRLFNSVRVHSFDPTKILGAVQVAPGTVLAKDGENLAAALDRLRDQSEENYDELRRDLNDWLPEYDRILLDSPRAGHKALQLRQARTKQPIQSKNLSEGTLVALALLVVAHDHNPPDLICLEEPERNVHPRLLKDVRDALFKLSFPKEFGIEKRPVQIILTTHSPVFLNLLGEHPESIIVAEKNVDGTATFHQANKDPHFQQIVGDAPLGEVWVTGVLGGVPSMK